MSTKSHFIPRLPALYIGIWIIKIVGWIVFFLLQITGTLYLNQYMPTKYTYTCVRSHLYIMWSQHTKTQTFSARMLRGQRDLVWIQLDSIRFLEYNGLGKSGSVRKFKFQTLPELKLETFRLWGRCNTNTLCDDLVPFCWLVDFWHIRL